MKNVYSLQAFGLSPEEFRIRVWYNDPSTGVDLNYIPRAPLEGELLIQVLGMDRIDIVNPSPMVSMTSWTMRPRWAVR